MSDLADRQVWRGMDEGSVAGVLMLLPSPGTAEWTVGVNVVQWKLHRVCAISLSHRAVMTPLPTTLKECSCSIHSVIKLVKGKMETWVFLDPARRVSLWIGFSCLFVGPDLLGSSCLSGPLPVCSPLAPHFELRTHRVAGTWQNSTWWRPSCPLLKASKTSCRWASPSVYSEAMSKLPSPPSAVLPALILRSQLLSTVHELRRGCTGTSQGSGFGQQRWGHQGDWEGKV